MSRPDFDDVNRIYVEVLTGKEPKRPDTAEESVIRRRLHGEVAVMKAKKLVPHVPAE